MLVFKNGLFLFSRGNEMRDKNATLSMCLFCIKQQKFKERSEKMISIPNKKEGSTSLSRMQQSRARCVPKHWFLECHYRNDGPHSRRVHPGSSGIERTWYSPFSHSFQPGLLYSGNRCGRDKCIWETCIQYKDVVSKRTWLTKIIFLDCTRWVF